MYMEWKCKSEGTFPIPRKLKPISGNVQQQEKKMSSSVTYL